MLNDVIRASIPSIEAVLGALASLVLAYAARLIAAHTKNATIAGIETRLVSAVSDVVGELNQTVVDDMKNQNTFDATAARNVMNDAIAKLKDHLGPKGIDEVEKVLQPGNLQTMLVTRIEAEVAKQASFAPLVTPEPITAEVPKQPPPVVAEPVAPPAVAS